jgi:hypothetical protein
MKQWLRRVRGILGLGSLWGLAGSAVGAIVGIVARFFGGLPPGDYLIDWVLGAGGLGFVLGAGFAGFLTMMEGRRTLEELSPGRAAVWGALAGASVPALWFLLFFSFFSGPLRSVLPIAEMFPVLLGAAGAYGALSAGLASATVWVARRAPSQLLPGGASDEPELLSDPEKVQFSEPITPPLDQAETKHCPYCDEVIREKATKCRYCKSDLA